MLIQGVLASSKLKPGRIRKSQAGEKCPLCGEHEVLHDLQNPETKSAGEYSAGVRSFWDRLRDRSNTEGNNSEVGKNERLCAICSVKRFLPRVLKQQNMRDELLYDVVAGAERFQSTTEIAAYNYLARLKQKVGTIKPELERKLFNALHESEMDGLDDEASKAVKAIIDAGRESGVEFTGRDKYYAILLMDGDKMGDLINGKTLTATWGSIIHPELKERYADHLFQPPGDVLRACLKEKRILNPALHATISDSLNSFARFAVAPLVAKGNGRLIYAGGDDVCAILPLDTVLDTADAIRKAYTASFVRYTANGVVPCETSCGTGGRIGVHLGSAPEISISAGIVIAHYKEPLREVLNDAHTLLDGVAKKKGGRNAVAIRLKKRSGGDRDFFCNWDERNPFMPEETKLDSFREIVNGAGTVLSRSLLYRLSSLKDGIAPMKESITPNLERIVRLFQYEVAHSGLPDKTLRVHAAERLAGITLALKNGEIRRGKDGKPVDGWFNPEAAVIAAFMGREER